MHQGLPYVLTVRDLKPLYEAFSEDDDEDGNPIFLYSSFGFITEDFVAHFGRSNLRKYHLTPEIIQQSLELLPDDDVYPMAPPDVMALELPPPEQVFVKSPMLNTAFLGTGLLPKLTLQEVEILECLMSKPHPNIVRYRGCLIHRGRIVGIGFDRLRKTLYERLQQQDAGFNIESCLESITSAVQHLHALGLAHNDLNPSNIMVDEFDTCCIIDFGSCRPFDHDLITAGSRGWIEEEFTTSAGKHDDIAVTKIRAWLQSRVLTETT